jgi:hypothetical protein
VSTSMRPSMPQPTHRRSHRYGEDAMTLRNLPS